MKTLSLHSVLLALAVTISASSVSAQTPLPYYTGFDNTSQQTGWQEIRQGVNSIEDWTKDTGGYSAPKMLVHDYPVGGASTDTVLDWYVSPPFHFYGGGHIDSLKLYLLCFNNIPTPDDLLEVYLLKDAPDPAAATAVTLLADLTHKASNSNTWLSVGSIAIPPTAGTSYIAFKYRATNDWFVAHIDDIHLSGDTSASVANSAIANDEIAVFPNPASQTINISLPGGKTSTVALYDVYGRLIKKQVVNTPNASFDISSLSIGAYYIFVPEEGRLVKAINWVKN